LSGNVHKNSLIISGRIVEGDGITPLVSAILTAHQFWIVLLPPFPPVMWPRHFCQEILFWVKFDNFSVLNTLINRQQAKKWSADLFFNKEFFFLLLSPHTSPHWFSLNSSTAYNTFNKTSGFSMILFLEHWNYNF